MNLCRKVAVSVGLSVGKGSSVGKGCQWENCRFSESREGK